jgi:catechol 2,3-dioxygenase-like lactoylglutathione lyase family enzyme
MAIDYGCPPKGGFAKLVSELLVEDLCESLYFWREALGFEIAYQRPEQKFAFLERPEGAQIMLCERSGGRWETAPIGQAIRTWCYVPNLHLFNRSKHRPLEGFAGANLCRSKGGMEKVR